MGVDVQVPREQVAEPVVSPEQGLFRVLLEAAPDAAVIIDPSGRIAIVNRQTEVLFGYLRSELIGHPLEVLLPERFRDLHAQHRARYLRDPHPRPRPMGVGLDLVGRGKDGHEFPVDVSLSATDTDRGRLTMAFIRDISARRLQEEALRASEERYRRILETANEAFVALDAEGRITDWNDQAEAMFGWACAEAVGRSLLGFVIPDASAASLRAVLLAEKASTPGPRMELPALRKGAATFPIDVTAWRSGGAAGDQFNVLIRDATERHRAADALARAYAEAEGRARELEQRNHDIALLGDMGDLLQCSATDLEVYRVFAEFGRRLFPDVQGAIFMPGGPKRALHAVATWGWWEEGRPGVLVPQDCWALRRGRSHIVDVTRPNPACPHLEGEPVDSICIPLMAQGEALGLLTLVQARRVAPGPGDDGDGHRQSNWQAICQLGPAVGERVALALANFQLRERLRLQAIRDPLTGLFNRRHLDEMLDRELGRCLRDGTPLAVIMMDIDHFKLFNDEFGHIAGDQLLTGLGRLLRDASRGSDIACRYGGEEFTLVLPGAGVDDAARKAEGMRHAALGLTVPAADRPVTLSFGIAAFPAHGEDADVLLEAADRALYAAKMLGRDRIEVAGTAATAKETTPHPRA